MPFDPTLQDKGSWFYDTSDGSPPPLVGDGKTYSRALGWQSPEGNFYGQERWVRDWYSAVIYDGTEYRILAADGNAASVDKLPMPGAINPNTGEPYGPRPFMEIWSVPRTDWPPSDQGIYDGRTNDYYWWDTVSQSWKEAIWYFQCDGEDELPNPGIAVGAAHVIVYHDIKVVWTGYYWQRYCHDMLDLATDAEIHVPYGFIGTTQTQIQTLITGQSATNQQLANINALLGTDTTSFNNSISQLQNDISQISSTNAITLAEANTLNLLYTQLQVQSTDLSGLAQDLNITTEVTNYNAALATLGTTLSPWVNQAEYPLVISSDQRTAIGTAFSNAQTALSSLQKAIQQAQINGLTLSSNEFQQYVNGELSTLGGSLTNLTTQVDQYSSDNYVSLIEANSLQLTLGQITAESNNIIALADSYNLQTEAATYQTALTTLANNLAPFINQTTYPIAITSTQRTQLDTDLAAVQTAKTALQSAITNAISTTVSNTVTTYVDNQIGIVNNDISSLGTQISSISSESQITLAESNSLALSLAQVVAESTDLINSANTLGVTTEKTNYQDAISALQTALAAWTSTSNTYPLPITSNARTAITNAFQTVQSTKSILINAIRNTQANGISSNVTTLNNLLNSSVSSLNSSISNVGTEITQFSSAGYITLGEANALQISLAELNAESTNIVSLATSLSITTEKQNYSTALTTLQSALSPFVGQNSYPLPITAAQRTAISAAFSSVQTTKTALQNAITNVANANSINTVKAYVDSQIQNVTATAGLIVTQVQNAVSDLSITQAEATNLSTSYTELQTEQQSLDATATALSVSTTAFDNAVTALGAILTPWFNQAAYPVNITQDVANNTNTAATTLNDAKSSLVAAISTAQTNAVQSQINSLSTVVTNNYNSLNSSIADLGSQVNNVTSSASLTYAEASQLRITFVQVMIKSQTLVASAAAVNVTTELTNYENALQALTTDFAKWFPIISFGSSSLTWADTVTTFSDVASFNYSYPMTIDPTLRDSIRIDFQNVQSTEAALQQAILTASNTIVSENLTSSLTTAYENYVTTQINTVNSSITSLGNQITQINSDGYITAGESNALAVSLAQVQSESTDLIFSASALNITTEKTNYQTAISTLETVLQTYINQTTYPITIAPEIRTAISTDFSSVQNTKSVLITAINNALINGVNTSISSLQTSVNTSFNSVNISIADLNTSIDNWGSQGFITLPEANGLNVQLSQIVAESQNIISMAASLNITTEKDAYSTSITALQNTLAAWINQSSYPITIKDTDRTTIDTDFQNVQNAKVALQNKINNTIASNTETSVTNTLTQYINNQISTINSDVANLGNSISAISSQESLTLSEANGLQLALSQVLAESTNILNAASLLGITDDKNIYSSNLSTLQTDLAPWLGQSSYPLTITPQQRTSINTAFANVQTAKTVLVNDITNSLNNTTNANVTALSNNLTSLQNYVNSEIATLNSSITSLGNNISAFSSDNNITLAEANTLNLLLNQTLEESSNLESLATSLGITTDKTTYANAVTALQNALLAWINQPSYPLPITSTQRNAITTSFQNVQAAQAILNNDIVTATATNSANSVSSALTGYINSQVSNLNSNITSVQNAVAALSLETNMTQAEANSLQIAMNQLIAQSTNINNAASLLNISADKTAYDNNLSTLQGVLAPWLGQSSYPIAITAAQRTAITNAFQNVQSSEAQLVSDITAALNTANTTNAYNISSVSNNLSSLQTYVNNEVNTLSTSLNGLNSSIQAMSSSTTVTYDEANSLNLALAQVNSESTNLVSLAGQLGITTDRNAYLTALTNLQAALAPFLNQGSYPVSITAPQRSAITSAFQAVQTAKITLNNDIINAINTNTNTTLTALINSEVSGINSTITTLGNDIAQYSSQNVITLAEANALQVDLSQVVSGSQNLINDAQAFSLTSQISTFQTAISTLQSTLNPFIGQSGYPLAITLTQRNAIQAAFNAVQAAETALIAAIHTAQSTQITNGVNTVQANLLEAFQEADIPFDDTWQTKVSTATLVFESPTQLGLQATKSGTVGGLWVQGQLVMDVESGSASIQVHNSDPVLDWDSTNNVLTVLAVQPSTEYYVYLANYQDSSYNVGGRDARGKLFLSLTPDTNQYLSLSGAGLHARVVGQIRTDGAGLFLNEVSISWVGQTTSFPETYRDYCDYTLSFVDENTIKLQMIDGEYGQIYVAGSMLKFGDNVTFNRTMTRVTWTGSGFTPDTSQIAPNTLYYVYISNDADQWNFNAINPATNRPWQQSDVNASGNYQASEDLRQSLVLSVKAEEHGVMSEVFPGYYSRWIGTIQTDSNGFFIYSPDLSVIRSLQLNPTYLSGLAEIEFVNISTSIFKVASKKGSSGICMVGNIPVQTFAADNNNCHTCMLSDVVYRYSESDITSPLTPTGNDLNYYVQRNVYLYLTNDRPIWQSLANSLVLCDTPPEGGYLSSNWSGNNARWLATLKVQPGTLGPELVSNGNFIDSSNWVGSSWNWSATNQNMTHSSGDTTPLIQSTVVVSAGAVYQIKFTTSNVTSGSLTPSIGNSRGTEVFASQDNAQFIIASDTTPLYFFPSSDFVGSIDSVSCTQVTNASFSGSFITDSLAPPSPTIDNSVVGTNILWDSAKIMQVIGDAIGYAGNTSGFSAQKVSGIGVRLEYVDASNLRLVTITGSDLLVIFPDLSQRVIPASGINIPVVGVPNVRYYVYLSSSSCFLSTIPPDGLYSRLETLGIANIQVGDVVLSNVNSIANPWNVCSSQNEPARSWSLPITSSSQSLSLPNLMISKRSGVSVNFNNVTTATCSTYQSAAPYNSSPLIVSGLNTNSLSLTVNYSIYYPNVGYTPYTAYYNDNYVFILTCSATSPTFVEGINNLSANYSDSCSVTPTQQNFSHATVSVTNRTGGLVFLRQGK